MSRFLILVAALVAVSGMATPYTSSPPALPRSNTVYVTVGNSLLVFTGDAPLTAAKTAAASNSVAVVGPGTYRENDLLKDGIRWDFFDGAVVHYTNQIVTDAKAIFDDNGTAMNSSVDGNGEFIFEGNQEDTVLPGNFNGQIAWLKNPSSKMHFRAKRCANAPGVNVNDFDPGLIVITSCSYFFGDFDLLEDNVTRGSRGIAWESGNAEIDVKRLSIYYYPIHLEEISGGSATKLTVRAGRVESLNFNPAVNVSGGSGLFTFNLHALEVSSRDSHFSSGGLLLGAGNTSITIGRLLYTNTLGNAPAIYCSGGTNSVSIGRTSVTMITNAVSGLYARVIGGTLDLTCPVVEASGTFLGDGIVVSGSGVFNYHGFGRMAVPNGQGLVHSNGTTTVQGLRIDTSATNVATNRPVAVAGAGLRLHDCMLISPVNTPECIFAGSAQTVICKDVAANTNKHVNVTVTGEAVLVNGAFR